MVEGREGDWECSGCRNRNYAFRSFCNRCKQPRLLVDTKTPADSKWLPRIGDWICTGCTNNNYASREKCKKCGQAKEVAAMPAVAMPGASLPTYSHYFSRASGVQEHNLNVGLPGHGPPQPQIPLNSSWSSGGANYGVQPTSAWPLGGNQISGLPYVSPKGWRNGDWICNCGFHNYSSRAQCKQCNASVPPALGTKRLASEEFVHDWENKRLNSGNTLAQQQTYPGFNQMEGSAHPRPSFYASYPNFGTPNWPATMQFPHQGTTQALLGKGAKHWRDGDWMCTNCHNHNYASRSQCNRCKTERDGVPETVAKPVEELKT